VVEMVQKLVLRNEVVKVKGRVKVITVKKEDFDKILKLTKLKILDKEYEALMPPLDGLQKNTIDVNGLATLVQQFTYIMAINNNIGSSPSPAQMVLTTTSGSNISLSFAGNISQNSQGVTLFMQVLQESNTYTFQYFYVGFDTTNSSYSTSQLELYVSAWANACYPNTPLSPLYTDLVRIAYTSASFTKTSDSYLFIVWLIEFQNIPPYLGYFTPIFRNNLNIIPYCGSGYGNGCYGTGATSYFNNGSCNFTCGRNCPASTLHNFIVYINSNSVTVEFPVQAPLNTGTSSVEVLLCSQAVINNLTTITGSTSATLTPPVSGATFYVAIATITITYQAS
jgi:hypothetical protein